MSPQDLAKLVSESGMGVLSFCALLYGGYRVLTWLEDVKSNHLTHINESLKTITENTTEGNKKLDEQTAKLDEILRK